MLLGFPWCGPVRNCPTSCYSITAWEDTNSLSFIRTAIPRLVSQFLSITNQPSSVRKRKDYVLGKDGCTRLWMKEMVLSIRSYTFMELTLSEIDLNAPLEDQLVSDLFLQRVWCDDGADKITSPASSAFLVAEDDGQHLLLAIHHRLSLTLRCLRFESSFSCSRTRDFENILSVQPVNTLGSAVHIALSCAFSR